MKKHSKFLDHVLLSASAYNDGDYEAAANYFSLAMQQDDAQESIQDLGQQQEQAFEEEDASAEQRFSRALASFNISQMAGEQHDEDHQDEEESSEEDEEHTDDEHQEQSSDEEVVVEQEEEQQEASKKTEKAALSRKEKIEANKKLLASKGK